MKTIILTGGGTAGHITPNIALIPRLQKAGFRICYIGLAGGMEEKLIREMGIPFYGIHGGKLRRYLDFKNVTDLFRISAGFFDARRLIHSLRPDVVFSKGGFVSTPVVWAASLAGVPVVGHESDMTVGLANKLCEPFLRKICYTFPETGAVLPKAKGVYTGLPIREELLEGSASKGLSLCGFSGGIPTVLVIGGSQGSGFINNMVRGALPKLLKTFQVCHVTGKGNLKPELSNTQGYKQFEYVTSELPHLLAAADVVLTRGGATSLFELLACKKPHVIIPYSLKASRGDQIVNAESFKKQGFSEVLAEVSSDGTPLAESVFLNTLVEVYNNKSRYIAAMEQSKVRDGLSNVFRVICETAGVEVNTES